MSIRNIVFDVGNVLLSYRWREMLSEDYGMTPSERDEFAKKILLDPLWPEFDRAVLPYGDVVEKYVKKYPEDEAAIRWFFRHTELMPVPRPDVWERVRRLKESGYGIYLLSNYCQEMFSKHTAKADFMAWIDGHIISYEVHHIKPDAEIYQDLFRRYDLDPAECLFFDDRPENVNGSIASGMKAIRVTSEEQLIGELDRLL